MSTPIVGKLGDIHGKGPILSAVLLIAGRVLQGVAGGVFRLAFGIVRDTFPRDEVPGALGLANPHASATASVRRSRRRDCCSCPSR